jgi:hypothetical protein
MVMIQFRFIGLEFGLITRVTNFLFAVVDVVKDCRGLIAKKRNSQVLDMQKLAKARISSSATCSFLIKFSTSYFNTR